MQNAEDELKAFLEEKFHRAIPEISVYLIEGVGNDTRIDYGTGLNNFYRFDIFMEFIYSILRKF